MKATKSKDGINRFTMAVKIRIGRQDIIDCIGWNLITYGVDLPRNRQAAIAVVKAVREKEGESVWTWAESSEATPVVVEEIGQLVDGLFPELK